MPQVDRPLAVNLLAQGGPVERGFEIVQRQGVAGQEPLDITPADEADEGLPGIGVKDRSRAHHPQNKALFPLMGQQFIELVVVDGKGGLPGEPGAKGELRRRRRGPGKGPGVHDRSPPRRFLPGPGPPNPPPQDDEIP